MKPRGDDDDADPMVEALRRNFAAEYEEAHDVEALYYTQVTEAMRNGAVLASEGRTPE